jgi:hypothetical protein
MSESMWLDAAGLRVAGPAFGYVSASLATTLAGLSEVLDAAGNCWGSDQTGASFAESYLPNAQLVRSALPMLRDDVAGVGAAVVAVADNADAAENRAQTRLS